MTQSSGTAAMSVEMSVVAPSMRLEGTKAHAAQRSARAVPTAAWDSGAACAAGVSSGADLPGRLATADAQAASNASTTRYPIAQTRLWSVTLTVGSSTNG